MSKGVIEYASASANSAVDLRRWARARRRLWLWPLLGCILGLPVWWIVVALIATAMDRLGGGSPGHSGEEGIVVGMWIVALWIATPIGLFAESARRYRRLRRT